MAINTMYTYLMSSSDGTSYTKLIDIKDFSDLSQPPEMLDATTLTDEQRVYVAGITEAEALTFTCNYSKSDYTTLAALAGTDGYYAVWFGASGSTPDGHDGKFSFKGDLRVTKSGAGVNEVQDMVVTIAPSTKVTVS